MIYTFSPGRTITVHVYRDTPRREGEFRFITQCSTDGFAPSDPQSHAVEIDGIASGRASLADSFWRLWMDYPAPNTATNARPPATLTSGDIVAVNGKTWHGGNGAPSPAIGALGHWYADLTNGTVYKRCRGAIAKVAERHAEMYDRACTAQSQIAALNLPDLPTGD